MLNRVIITKEQIQDKETELMAVYDDSRMIEIHAVPAGKKSLLGNIYIGRVQSIVENLEAAFIEIADKTVCFCPLKELKNPIFTKKTGKKPICQGDELLVEVTKESHKTKPPMASANLNFSGQYLVLTSQNKKVGVSKKIGGEIRKELQQFLEPYVNEEFGVVVRTNAQYAKKEDILAEFSRLKEQYLSVKEQAVHRTAFSLIREAQSEEMQFVKGLYMEETAKITTDIPEVYDRVYAYFKEYRPKDLDKLCFYEDKLLSLPALYNIKREMGRALEKRVWLPSGGYLIIEPTEAMTVIDVNSGRNTRKMSKEELIFLTNKEAAKEIARQLILRNISGICIVDFIDMGTEKQQEELLHLFRMELKKDKIPVALVDITRLGLVELTRKKVQKSLREQLRGDESYEQEID